MRERIDNSARAVDAADDNEQLTGAGDTLLGSQQLVNSPVTLNYAVSDHAGARAVTPK
jgi:hypothetical protein